MRISVLGSTGLLGRAVVDASNQMGWKIRCSGKLVRIEDFKKTREFIADAYPDFVINCVAFTDVDGAETIQGFHAANMANNIGAYNLAIICKDFYIPLIHMSTDYVFSGDTFQPYFETDKPNPRSNYARTKLLGEMAIQNIWEKHWILRTSWLYGAGKKGFVNWVIDKMLDAEDVSIEFNSYGSPTYAPHLAKAIVQLIENSPPFGLYHVTNSGEETREGLALRCRGVIEKILNRNLSVKIDLSDEKILTVIKAERPDCSVLDCSKWQEAGMTPLAPWEDALDEYLMSLKLENRSEAKA